MLKKFKIVFDTYMQHQTFTEKNIVTWKKVKNELKRNNKQLSIYK